MKRPILRIGIEESDYSQLKGPGNIFNKILEENLANLKKEMIINIQIASEYQIDWTRKEIPSIT
jgi:hypothetical protein